MTTTATTTLTWTANSGNSVSAEIGYSVTYYPPSDIDGGWGGTIRESYAEHITVTYTGNGRVLGTETRLPMRATPGYHPQEYIDAGCTVMGLLRTPEGTNLQLALTGITLDEFEVAVEEMRANTAPAEVRALIAAEREAQRQRNLANAAEIMACAHVFETQDQLRAWRRRYNDIHNEGGEGFAPRAVTQADQDWARAILGQAEAGAAEEVTAEEIIAQNEDADIRRYAMTGQDWLNLINNKRDDILQQMRPHWRNATANRKAGLEVLLYLESDGTITTLTRSVGGGNWRDNPEILPLGDSYSNRPGYGVTEADILDQVINNNALYDW